MEEKKRLEQKIMHSLRPDHQGVWQITAIEMDGSCKFIVIQ